MGVDILNYFAKYKQRVKILHLNITCFLCFFDQTNAGWTAVDTVGAMKTSLQFVHTNSQNQDEEKSKL